MTLAVHRIAKYSSQNSSLLFFWSVFLSLTPLPSYSVAILSRYYFIFILSLGTNKKSRFNPSSFFSFCFKFFLNYSPLSLFLLLDQFSLFLTIIVYFSDFLVRNQDGQHLSESHLPNQRTEASVCKYVLFCIDRDLCKLCSITIICKSVVDDCYDS